MSTPRSPLHPTTWVVWTAIAAAAALLTHNPLYLGILLGVVAIHYMAAARGRPEAQGWWALLRVVIGLGLLVIPFNALNVHAGTHVLFRLPAHWPLIGGNITLEAVVWGATNALGLVVLIVLFAAFNLRVDQAQLLRLTPAFIYEAGLIVSIALTFVPQMMLSAREIREAQLIRGHRMRRVRDMLPFVMALLTTGLERSFQLAESMEARGFGNVRDRSPGRDLVYKALTLVGLGGVLSGVFVVTYFAAWQVVGWAALLGSAVLLIGVFWAQGRRVLRTHYHHDRWTWRDGLVLAASLGAVSFVIWGRAQGATLTYYPYTALAPSFDPGVGVALLALVVPVLIHPPSRTLP